jgi:hypothetical protein
MKTTYKTAGYDFTRKAEKRPFKYATIFRNCSYEDDIVTHADFHVSLELAEKDAKRISKLSHLELVEIVEVHPES